MDTNSKSNKSLCVAYFFWLIGGFFGLHQIYLGRDNHAFAIWISLGGYFGIAVVRDLWNIPSYVAEANHDKKYVENLIKQIQTFPKPSLGISGFLCALTVSNILGHLVYSALPYELIDPLTESRTNNIAIWINSIAVPIAIAIGVHIVGNIGRLRGAFRYPLIGALLTSPLYHFGYDSVFVTSLVSTIAYQKCSLRWDRRPPIVSLSWKRIFTIIIVGITLTTLWSSWFYFNCTVTDKNDETIKCREAVKNFFKSPAWLEFMSVMGQLREFIAIHGFSGLWNEIVQALDPTGQQNALKIFNLTDAEATPEKITARYRSLAKQWHPDKHRDPEAKAKAQDMFMSISQAYDTLSNLKRQRNRN